MEMILYLDKQTLKLIHYNNILRKLASGAARSSDNDSTGFWPPGSLHTLDADGHI